ncbi:hypothetical protein CABS01_17101 [Colletotrichum abscissum]|uniref:uncharacterized protein n=1 Tax=Colletotrichum abscissum TaxID=1671311 RepID=UPI0027D51B28|nr:uncharacterized protein CABS01_17101 [Colletotrichum abscissum]KAK1492666.1 hypothetical protein CABS01_17101 [Colletotrichum abscissum]
MTFSMSVFDRDLQNSPVQQMNQLSVALSAVEQEIQMLQDRLEALERERQRQDILIALQDQYIEVLEKGLALETPMYRTEDSYRESRSATQVVQ